MSPKDEYEGLSSTFAAACRKADEQQHRKPIDPHIKRLRRLAEDDVTLVQAWAEIHRQHFEGRAAASTVEALMLSLRWRGTRALSEPDTRRRISELNDKQLAEVGDRLQRLKPNIARAWTSDEVGVLVKAWRQLHGI